MKQYTLIPQEKDNYCVCSILQAILDRHGAAISQSDIAAHLTPSKHGFQVDDEKIRQFLQRHGFSYTHYRGNEVPFNEPDLFLQELHNHDGIIGIKMHAYLLQAFDGSAVDLIDPKDKKIVTEDYYEMVSKAGFYGLLKIG